MEQICGLVPMDPHAAQVVTQQVEQRVPRQKAECVRDPVGLIGIVEIVGLVPPPQLSDGLGTSIIGPRPDAQGDPVESVRRVLLKNKRMVDAVGLCPTGANLDVVGEASLCVGV